MTRRPLSILVAGGVGVARNTVPRIERWGRRHPRLRRILVMAAVVGFGVVLVEVVRIDQVDQGMWRRFGPGSVVPYALVGAIGAWLAFHVGWCAWFVLLAVGGTVRWCLRAPGRVLRWARRVGGRGVAGHGLTALLAGSMAGALYALGGYRFDGVALWVEIFVNGVFGSLVGGGAGALAALIVARALWQPFAGRLPDPVEHGPTRILLASLGYVVGAALLWGEWGPGHPLAGSSVPGLEWVRADVAFVVVHAYTGAVVVGWRVLQDLRRRAGLAARPAPPTGVWDREGERPERPTEHHWSPDPVIGWRTWTIADGDLVGHYGRPWPTATMEAHCDAGHAAPDWDCTCGIYATKRHAGSFGHVAGQVAMEGIVIEHEDGYRAERATIVELRVRDTATEEWARRRYPDVPVRVDRPVRSRN